jgi:hypothetical protein
MISQLLPRSPRLSSKNLKKSTDYNKIIVTWKNDDIPKDREQFFLFMRFDWTNETNLIPIEQEERNPESMVISGVANLPYYCPSVYYYLKLVVVNCFGGSSSRWIRMKRDRNRIRIGEWF